MLVGLILGTMVTFILEKKFLYAAIASAVGAVLSFIGLIHAPEVAWAANPQVALGYLFFGIVCLAYSFLPARRIPSWSTRPTSSPVTSRLSRFLRPQAGCGSSSGAMSSRGPVGRCQWNAMAANRSTVASTDPATMPIHCGET